MRHGQNVDNLNGILNGHRDEPLTPLGESQAAVTANHIKELGLVFNCVYSSPLIRAYRTAEVITDILKIEPPKILDSLIERDFGIMTGKKISQIVEICSPDIIQTDTITYFLSPEGAETFPQLIERVKKLFEELDINNKSGSILLVTHGDIGKMIYASYYNLSWEDVLTSFHFGNADILLLSEDSPAEESHVIKQGHLISKLDNV